MTKPLSAEQKAIRKKAATLRRAAFHRRLGEEARAVLAAIEPVNAGPLKRQQDAAEEAEEAARKAGMARIEPFRNQIAELEAQWDVTGQRAQLRNQIATLKLELSRVSQEVWRERERLMTAADEASKAYHQAYSEALVPVREAFSDVRCVRSTRWKPLSDFFEEAEAALKMEGRA